MEKYIIRNKTATNIMQIPAITNFFFLADLLK